MKHIQMKERDSRKKNESNIISTVYCSIPKLSLWPIGHLAGTEA